MVHIILVDIVVLIHFLFILFVLFGGLLLFWSSRVFWLHVPAVLWAAMIEFSGWVCPLTPLENLLRAHGGTTTYATGFIEHYILPLIYPDFLTRKLQIIFGLAVLGINLAVYGLFFYRKLKKPGH